MRADKIKLFQITPFFKLPHSTLCVHTYINVLFIHCKYIYTYIVHVQLMCVHVMYICMQASELSSVQGPQFDNDNYLSCDEALHLSVLL